MKFLGVFCGFNVGYLAGLCATMGMAQWWGAGSPNDPVPPGFWGHMLPLAEVYWACLPGYIGARLGSRL